MGVTNDLNAQVREIFKGEWTKRDGRTVPDPTTVKQSNDAVKLQGTVLYADMASSTALVTGYKPWYAAEMYKVFLRCAARIIRDEQGSITSYDGDRIMAVFIGKNKNTRAVRTGLKINYAVKKIINPAITDIYPKSSYRMAHSVGIDTSDLFVANTGVRGDNDLVWVGRSANWAAKMSDLPSSHPTWITEEVYDSMAPNVTHTDGKHMWEAMTWKKHRIYRSTWRWRA